MHIKLKQKFESHYPKAYIKQLRIFFQDLISKTVTQKELKGREIKMCHRVQ